MTEASIGGQALKAMFGGGLRNLAENVTLINELNVFPVPDGDTGVNMLHSLRRAWQEIAKSEDDDLSALAQRFAYGALMGARGNSGTIMSQLLAGFADGLKGAHTLTAPLFVQACHEAVVRAYAAVSQPVEGTMLTVAREAAESLSADDALEDNFACLISAAKESLERTPQLLPILREAGVVDAGGMGLLCFLQGIHQQCAGGDIALPLASALEQPTMRTQSGEDYGYDLQFIMLGEGLDLPATRAAMERLGWSVIVVGDSAAIKVHVHTENPALPLDYALKTGAALDDIVIENMQLQAQDFARRADQPYDDAVSIIAVAEGVGMTAIFRDLHCNAIIPGGAGSNPATEDFIQAIDREAARHIIILPNHKDIALAARQAAELKSERQVTILPTKTMLAGISALLAYGDARDQGADTAALLASMTEAAQSLTAIQITRATRPARLHGLDIAQGDYIAIIDGEIRVASRDLLGALRDALRLAPLDDKDLVTLYCGAELDMPRVEQFIEGLSREFAELEFQALYGGQALYPLLASVE